VSLHRLRQILGNEKALQLRDGCPRLDPSICWVDAHAFEEILTRAEKADHDEGEWLTERALSLYRGHFLNESDEPWLISCRERLRNRFLRAVWRRGERLEKLGRFDLALELYRRGLDVDPLAEELYRRLMRCHHTAGQKSEAISVYERCKKVLRSVMGIDPSPETEALHRAIFR
jgi:DNA-binding SARP family transcriptional activator